MTNKTIAAVLLDLDGTLIDTAPDLAAALNVLRSERGLEALPVSRLRHLASFGARGMLGGGLNMRPDDPDYEAARSRFIDLYAADLSRHSRPFDGMREVLAELAALGIAWGVVTNKTEALARPLMRDMAFDPAPVCIVGGDTAAHPKPHPAPLLLACEQTGLDPAACVYVGDSDRDIAAGRAAGMHTVAVSYGYIEDPKHAGQWQADAVIDHAAELPYAVRQFHGKQAAADAG